MKIGFLFGAGAEVGYGLPSGGKFALDIFRYDSLSSKNEFKEMRDLIDKNTKYASSWLPIDYDSKSISSFGKSVFENIIKDTVEHNRYRIIKNLNNFDVLATNTEYIFEKSINEKGKDIIERVLGKDIEDTNMKHTVAFTEAFKDGDKLFSNCYFSSLFAVYKQEKVLNPSQKNELRKILLSIIQLQVGALSEDLTRRINDNLFSKKDDEIDLFDDLGDIIQLNYRTTGLVGLEYLLEKREGDVTTDGGKIICFAQLLIEELYSSVLDYKSLIDSHWHYLYAPKSEWAKFCKINIFLRIVRCYILKTAEQADFIRRDGYYHHLRKAIDDEKFEISKIATTNYNEFISKITKQDIAYLNGSTSLWYDPYLNKILNEENPKDRETHFVAPLIFTQSGTKPMTSIDMSMVYVDTYKSWNDSDAIVVIGFGFNADDEHINGILRNLVNEDGKKLIVVQLKKDGTSDEEMIKEICDKLKIKTKSSISIIYYDENNPSSWTDKVIASY